MFILLVIKAFCTFCRFRVPFNFYDQNVDALAGVTEWCTHALSYHYNALCRGDIDYPFLMTACWWPVFN